MKKQVKNFILSASISTQLLVVPTLTALSCSKATKNEIQEVLNDVSKMLMLYIKIKLIKQKFWAKILISIIFMNILTWIVIY